MPVLKGWKSPPERLPDGFTMTRSVHDYAYITVCEAWTSPDGWELRLITDGQSLIATVVRSTDEMRALIERWRCALLEIGWS